MSRFRILAPLPWIGALLLVPVALAGWTMGQSAAAGELDKIRCSLSLIPDDAAFYGTMLRNRELYEAVVGSRAWAKLKDMPFVQMGLAMYKLQAADEESIPGKIQAALGDPDVQKLIDLAGELASREIFVYGDAGFVDAMDLLQQVSGATRYGPLLAQLGSKGEKLSEEKLQMALLLGALAQNPERIKAPNLIVGFRLGDAAAAKEQLDRLEKLAAAALEEVPDLKGRLKRSKVDGREYLVLSLDSSMIPWDEIPLEELKQAEAKPGDAEKVIARLKKVTLVVALGIRDDYLLLAIGESTDCLKRLGSGARLGERPELKPLARHADKRITSISYVSQPMMRQLSSTQRDIDQLLQAVHTALPQTDLKEDQKARIRKDADALAKDLKELIPEPGAAMAFSFLTDQGIEGYQYDWGDNSFLDGSKPLGLLEHVGGNPMLAAVARGKPSVSRYDLLVKWLKIGYGYFEEFALPTMSENERQKFEQFARQAKPLMMRVDKATREMLIPALADGQIGLVVDTKLQSKHFIESLPATEKPMPMIEPALVLGVSNSALLLNACGEYRAVAQGLLEAVRQIEGSDVPKDFKLPEAQMSVGKNGMIFTYPLPEDWGVDKVVLPNFGLSAKVAVFSVSKEHTERLLATTPLKVGGVLAAPNRPLAHAAAFDWAALLEAATPWVDLAVAEVAKQQEGDKTQAAAIASQVRTVLEVLKVLRTVTSESYFEDGALVSHSLVEVRDLGK